MATITSSGDPELGADRSGSLAPDAGRVPLPRQILVVGAVGGLLLGIGAFRLGVTPTPDPFVDLPGLHWLSTSPSGAFAAMGLIVTGMALLVGAWLAIGRVFWQGRRLSPGSLRRAFWAWSAPLLLAPPLLSRDAYSYAAQAHLAHIGLNPYLYGPGILPGSVYTPSVDPIWMYSPAPYGPLVLWLSGHVVGLVPNVSPGWRVYLAVLGVRLIAVAGVVMLLYAVPRLARTLGWDPGLALWLGVLNPLVLGHFVSGAHNDALMLGLLMIGLALVAERRLLTATVAITLAVAIKVPAIVGLGFVAMAWAGTLTGPWRRVRAFTAVGVVSAALFTAVTTFTGLGWGWISALGTPGMVRTLLSTTTTTGTVLGWLAGLVGLQDVTNPAISVLRLLGTAAGVVVVAWLVLRRRQVDVARGTGLALLAIVALSPAVQPWYVLWAVVPLAASRLSTREVTVLTWSTVALTFYSLVNGSTMIAGVSQVGTVAVFAAACAVVVIDHRRALRGSRWPSFGARPPTRRDPATVQAPVVTSRR
ncbi:MAG: polyprenol phosphomannose-dependent alpha 1,6 mannosyltransferase MptB [Actinomycetes bacterium]